MHGGQSSRAALRDAKRKNGNLRGTYGEGLLQTQRLRNQAAQAKLPFARDEHGAATMVGQRRPVRFVSTVGVTLVGWSPGRRIWLGGISAQRGY